MNTKSSSILVLSDLASIVGPVKVEFKLVLLISEGRNNKGQMRPERAAHVEVFFDYLEFDIEVGWDLLALVASGRVPGGYYLGNCGCGEPGCSAIWNPIWVRHEGDEITWSIPTPYVGKKGDSSDQTMTKISFDCMQYRAQSDGLLADFRRFATDGGPLVRLNCYPGNLPLGLIEEANKGWEGYGGMEPLP